MLGSLLGVKASRCEVEDFSLRRTFFFLNKAFRKQVVTVVCGRLPEEEYVCGKRSCRNSKGQGSEHTGEIKRSRREDQE